MQLTINGRDLISLCDTGADHTVVHRDILDADTRLLPVGRPVKLANNEQCSGILGCACVNLQLGPFKQRACVYVANSLCEPCLLGADLLTASKAVVDISNGEITLLGEKLCMTMKGNTGARRSQSGAEWGP